jgi:anti-anti-sigma factor
MSAFEVRIEGDARVVVVGELDMATAPHLTSALDAVARAEPERVVVDLASVSFLDSSGLAALFLAQARLQEGGGVLVLGPISTSVRSVLQMAGLERAFVVEPPGG